MSRPESVEVTGSVRIPIAELDISTTTSGGPGGQHANRAETKVEVRFDVEASAALSQAQRERVMERAGPVVTVTADDERSQARNKDIALGRFAGRMKGLLAVPKTRRPTRPGRAAKRRRLEAKRHRGEVKRQRKPPGREG